MTKKYLNIREASEVIGLKEHIIRYWDSIDPKTNKLRIDGISTKSRAGTRYFNKDNLKLLQNLKEILYENGDPNPSLILASKILNSKKLSKNNSNNTHALIDNDFAKKVHQILKNMRKLLN